jgi:transcriptional regulator with XRE-family HTH domain
MILLPVQCQMARTALDWGVRELAAAAKVSADTVARFERGDTLKERTVEAIQHTLEAAGVEFIPENGGGPGVRLRKPVAKSASTSKAAAGTRTAAPKKAPRKGSS